jgi:hypothetical protein
MKGGTLEVYWNVSGGERSLITIWAQDALIGSATNFGLGFGLGKILRWCKEYDFSCPDFHTRETQIYKSPRTINFQPLKFLPDHKIRA